MTEVPALHAGDSAEQRRAERLMLDLFEPVAGVPLTRPLVLSAGAPGPAEGRAAKEDRR